MSFPYQQNFHPPYPNYVPQQQYPQQQYPPQQYPQQPYPQQPYTQQPYPQQPLPQQPLPQQPLPQQLFPQQSLPQQSLPQQSYPQQSYPQQPYPPQPYSQQSYSHQNLPALFQPHPQPQPQPQPNVQVMITPSLDYASDPSSYADPSSLVYSQQSRVLQDVQPNTSRQQVQTKAESPRAILQEEIDYAVLLLTLADEYLETAYASAIRSEEYYKLIATALGCLESVLNNFKLQPLREAQVVLKYSQILLDETQNNDDAEKVLTRAIDLCERNKLVDLKYASQSLLARILYRSKPKAAVKEVQSMIEDVEVYRHVAWEYCFRLLQVSFALGLGSVHDTHAAVSQLEKISAVARQNGDYAVFAFAALMEALVHLQTNHTDCVSSAQRALATARQLQLNPDVSENPQMQVLMEFIDLSCSLYESDLPRIDQKMKAMQQGLYKVLDKPGWHKNGVLTLPVSKRSLGGIATQEGGLVSEKGGRFFLTLHWLPITDIEILGFVLSAASVAHKNAADGGKAEKFIQEGLARLRSSHSDEDALGACAPSSESMTRWRKILECYLLLENTFLFCGRGSWTAARESLGDLERTIVNLDTALPVELSCVVQYLNGVFHQGVGDTPRALAIFQSPTFALSPPRLTPDSHQKKPGRPSSRHSELHNAAVRNISLLAAMNTALIIHSPDHPQNDRLSAILTTLESIIHTSPNKHIQASYALLLATLSDSSVLKQKQFLGNALSTSQHIGNAQITALTLILMSEKFFKGMVGEQAAKCAKAASHQARRAGDPLWVVVAGDMEAECMAVQGKGEEAQKMRDEASRASQGLPASVREGMRL